MAAPVKISFANNPAFVKTANRTDICDAVYYEPIHPISFQTRIERQATDITEVEKERKDSKTVFYLFGFIPLGTTFTYKLETQTVNTVSHFCEITPEMNEWVHSIKLYCCDSIRHQGKVNFLPTEDEIHTKGHVNVSPFIVEYGGITGIGWKRSST